MLQAVRTVLSLAEVYQEVHFAGEQACSGLHLRLQWCKDAPRNAQTLARVLADVTLLICWPVSYKPLPADLRDQAAIEAVCQSSDT